MLKEIMEAEGCMGFLIKVFVIIWICLVMAALAPFAPFILIIGGAIWFLKIIGDPNNR